MLGPKFAKLQVAEAKRLAKAARKEARQLALARRLASWRHRLDRWRAALKHGTAMMKGLAMFLAAISAMIGAGERLYHLMKSQELPPVLPAPTGIASTALDRVPEPTPPKR